MNTSESNQGTTTNIASGHVINLVGDTSVVEKNHITSTSKAVYILMFCEKNNYFIYNYIQHLLLHLEELSKSWGNYIEWSFTSIIINGQTKTNVNLWQTSISISSSFSVRITVT